MTALNHRHEWNSPIERRKLCVRFFFLYVFKTCIFFSPYNCFAMFEWIDNAWLDLLSEWGANTYDANKKTITTTPKQNSRNRKSEGHIINTHLRRAIQRISKKNRKVAVVPLIHIPKKMTRKKNQIPNWYEFLMPNIYNRTWLYKYKHIYIMLQWEKNAIIQCWCWKCTSDFCLLHPV